MTCACIDTINEKLAPDHYLSATMTFDGSPSRALIGLIRRDTWSLETRRSKRRTMAANFCPWCGEKYAHEEQAENLRKDVSEDGQHVSAPGEQAGNGGDRS